MAVRLTAAPPEVVAALRPHVELLLAQTAPVSLSNAIPVFSADAQDVIDERLLGAARQTAWLSIVSRNDSAFAAAEVALDLTPSHVQEGPLVGGLVEAVRMVESRFAGSGDYELRLLRIPAANAVALWLHGADSDLLIPVAPTPRALRANEAYGKDAFTAALRPLALVTVSE